MKGRRTVVVDLYGGVGNQLFQYSAGLAVSRSWDADLLVREQHPVGLQQFLSSELRHVSLSRIGRLALYRPRESLRSLAVWSARNARLSIDPWAMTFLERHAHDERPSRLDRSTKPHVGLMGYFQHPSWYEPVLDDVLDSMWGALYRVLVRTDWADAIGGLGQYTVVSFRRGDYVRLGWDLPIEYYRNALAGLPQRDQPLFIVCDDPVMAELARSWPLFEGFDCRPLPELECDSRVRDLAVLAHADQSVMANSTFCWWGTVLGDHLRSRNAASVAPRSVISPSIWNSGLANSSMLIRPEWERR